MQEVINIALFAIGALVPTLLIFVLVRWCMFKLFKQCPVWPCAGISVCLCIFLWSMGHGANTSPFNHLLAIIFYTVGVCVWAPFFLRKDRKVAARQRRFPHKS